MCHFLQLPFLRDLKVVRGARMLDVSLLNNRENRAYEKYSYAGVPLRQHTRLTSGWLVLKIETIVQYRPRPLLRTADCMHTGRVYLSISN